MIPSRQQIERQPMSKKHVKARKSRPVYLVQEMDHWEEYFSPFMIATSHKKAIAIVEGYAPGQKNRRIHWDIAKAYARITFKSGKEFLSIRFKITKMRLNCVS
jgi:hypothetical protein